MKPCLNSEGWRIELHLCLDLTAMAPLGLQTRYKCASYVQSLIHWFGSRSLTRFYIYLNF
jgi:hypothetical protein